MRHQIGNEKAAEYAAFFCRYLTSIGYYLVVFSSVVLAAGAAGLAAGAAGLAAGAAGLAAGAAGLAAGAAGLAAGAAGLAAGVVVAGFAAVSAGAGAVVAVLLVSASVCCRVLQPVIIMVLKIMLAKDTAKDFFCISLLLIVLRANNSFVSSIGKNTVKTISYY